MSSIRLGALAAFVACASFWAATAGAQVFRIVGPDGRVTFSDRPPVDSRATAAPTVQMGRPGEVATASLPMELRTVTQRFPLTLYTSKDCAPCDTARGFLSRRGIPFSERTVTTDADIRALQSVSGAMNVPFATLGSQHLKGFSEGEWGQYLDAAGYPKTSQLPPSYRNPAAAPLVAVQAPAAVDPTTAPTQADATPTPRAPAPAPSNPAGIRF
jgi:glutaredoxin